MKSSFNQALQTLTDSNRDLQNWRQQKAVSDDTHMSEDVSHLSAALLQQQQGTEVIYLISQDTACLQTTQMRRRLGVI